MDIRLQELLDKIRKDGIEAAQTDAAKVMADAEERRTSILAEAEREAKALLAKAKTDADRFEEAGKAALEQAARNLVISFRTEISSGKGWGGILRLVLGFPCGDALSVPEREAGRDRRGGDPERITPCPRTITCDPPFRHSFRLMLRPFLLRASLSGAKAGCGMRILRCSNQQGTWNLLILLSTAGSALPGSCPLSEPGTRLCAMSLPGFGLIASERDRRSTCGPGTRNGTVSVRLRPPPSAMIPWREK